MRAAKMQCLKFDRGHGQGKGDESGWYMTLQQRQTFDDGRVKNERDNLLS